MRTVPRSTTVATAAALALLAAAVFGCWMHWAVLDPRAVGWLLSGGDRGQAAIGLDAYLRAGAWPGLREPLLDAPDGLPLLFTDSIPLLALILGPFARWLPRGLQFVGPWLFGCMLLQAGFAWALVRIAVHDRLAAFLAAALLTAMPVLLNRFGHASLCAQWLVLWALWVFVEPKRAGRMRHWAPVLLIAAVVHSYLLLMVGAIWASAGLRVVARGNADRGFVMGGVAIAAAVVALLAWQGAFSGGVESTGTYGAFPMALDAWWNVQNPGFTMLIPSSPQDHGRGYEGLQYLGAGLLGLTIVSGALLLVRRGDRDVVAGLLWLVPAFALIGIVAVGPQPMWRGVPVLSVQLPPGVVDALDPIRSAGRLMWPATYAIAYAAIVVAARQRMGVALLAGAVALQLIDLTPMVAAIRATSGAAALGNPMPRTRDPRWPALIASARLIDVEPPRPFIDLQAMQEVTWRALAACRPVAFTYAARDPRDVRRRLTTDAAAFARGAIDPTRLYVMLDNVVPPALRDRAITLDGIEVIAPTKRAPPAVACR